MTNKRHLKFLATVFFVVNAFSLFAQNKDSNTNFTTHAHRYRFELSGGLGYLTGETKKASQQLIFMGVSSNEAEDYYKNLRMGEQAGVSFYYLFSGKMGLGLDYQFFRTENSVNGFVNSADGLYTFFGPFREKIYTNFVGLSFLAQEKIIREKLMVYSSVSLGWAFYRNESMIIVKPLLAEGNSPAVKYDLGLDIFLTKNISWGIKASYFLSALNKFTLNDGTDSSQIELDKKEKENLSRLNLSTGIHFYF